MNKPIKFLQKNGLTVYAFSCGYIQSASLISGDVETVVKLAHTGGNCYAVTVHQHGGKGQLHYTATDSIGHARKLWAQWVGLAHGAVIAQAKADKRYNVAREFCGESEARYIARFEREWIGKSDTAAGAWLLAYNDLRQRAAVLSQVQATAKRVDMITSTDFVEFLGGYIECLKWSTTGEADGREVESLEDFALSDSAHTACVSDCLEFFSANHADVVEAAAAYPRNDSTGMSHAGHDFWLTRAGHGAGFWDGDLPDALGERLTAASKAAGNREPYIGDDGYIYL